MASTKMELNILEHIGLPFLICHPCAPLMFHIQDIALTIYH
jgi:hypothetical protein